MSLHYKYDNWVKDQEGFGGHDRSMDVKEREKRCDGGGTIPANKFKITCAYPKEKSAFFLIKPCYIIETTSVITSKRIFQFDAKKRETDELNIPQKKCTKDECMKRTR